MYMWYTRSTIVLRVWYNSIMRYDKVLHVRITEKEYQGIVKRAYNKDMPVSEYIRFMIDLGEKAAYSDKHSEW